MLFTYRLVYDVCLVDVDVGEVIEAIDDSRRQTLICLRRLRCQAVYGTDVVEPGSIIDLIPEISC